jgi:hypothetical protein
MEAGKEKRKMEETDEKMRLQKNMAVHIFITFSLSRTASVV